MGDKFISGNNTVRENWDLALANDGKVDDAEIKLIVDAAKKWGGVSATEMSDATAIMEECIDKYGYLSSTTDSARQLQSKISDEDNKQYTIFEIFRSGGEVVRDVRGFFVRKLGLE